MEAQPIQADAAPRKWRRVLAALYGGRSYNRFEAARELHDHCLHSTVAELQEKGVTVEREREVVPGAYGPIHCSRYRLSPESRERAAALLERVSA